MKTATEAYQKELDQMLAKRDALHEQHMKRYANGTASRARTTTTNAQVTNMYDRIEWLRQEIKALA